ncbi:hypothetical protein L6Q79_15490 [bacterium]|nr:hypothetical protein [bacterium]NUN45407.1 hypothetical protein [bacterium]
MKTLILFLFSYAIISCNHKDEPEPYSGPSVFETGSLQINCNVDSIKVGDTITVKTRIKPAFDGKGIIMLSAGSIIITSPFLDTLGSDSVSHITYGEVVFEKDSVYEQMWKIIDLGDATNLRILACFLFRMDSLYVIDSLQYYLVNSVETRSKFGPVDDGVPSDCLVKPYK